MTEKDNIEYRKKIIAKIEKGEKISQKDFKLWLRKNPTYSEYLLKHYFFAKRKEYFICQHIIGSYIVDFYHTSLRLVIEIDGSSHDSKTVYDRKRYDYLMETGHKILVLEDKDVKNPQRDVFSCIADVIKYLQVLKNHNELDNYKGMIFRYSPLAFGTEEMLKGFSEEERKPEEIILNK